jgi:D-threo-aldose 1-dehydrogenase
MPPAMWSPASVPARRQDHLPAQEDSAMTVSLASHRPVGSTSLSLPPLGLGTVALGELYAPVSEEHSRATLEAAWDGGIRFYDTAPWYGRGLGEHRTGGFLRTKKRSDFVVTTKVGRYFRRPADPTTFDRAPWAGGLYMEMVYDYSYDGVMRSYEQSLLRLGLDTVDALLIHDPDPANHGEHHAARMKDMAESGILALEELKSTGQIKAVGMGLNETESLTTLASLVPLDFCIVAMPYTLLDQSSLGTGMQRCVDNDISVVVGAPFASGILATGPVPGARYRYAVASQEIRDKVGRMEALCRAHGVSLQAAALQFPLAHPAVVSVIPGMAHPAEVAQNIAAMQESVPSSLWTDLKADGLIEGSAPVPA